MWGSYNLSIGWGCVVYCPFMLRGLSSTAWRRLDHGETWWKVGPISEVSWLDWIILVTRYRWWCWVWRWSSCRWCSRTRPPSHASLHSGMILQRLERNVSWTVYGIVIWSGSDRVWCWRPSIQLLIMKCCLRFVFSQESNLAPHVIQDGDLTGPVREALQLGPYYISYIKFHFKYNLLLMTQSMGSKAFNHSTQQNQQLTLVSDHNLKSQMDIPKMLSKLIDPEQLR